VPLGGSACSRCGTINRRRDRAQPAAVIATNAVQIAGAALDAHMKANAGRLLVVGGDAGEVFDMLYLAWVRARWDANDRWVRVAWSARP
jgi:hypothetical protein